MSDLNLLVFGCFVTFIGVAGAYVYIRESFLAGVERRESNLRDADAVKHETSEVA